MSNLAKEIRKRFEKMSGARHNWEEHWADCAQYALPQKDDVYDWLYKVAGEKKNLRLYDSSAQHYNELLASALHSMLTNPSTLWFDLTTGDPKLDREPRVRGYLQKVVRKAHRILNNSNFQTEIHEVFLDLGGFGTASMRIEEDDETFLKFHSRPIFELHVAENYKGEVDTVFTIYKMSVRQAFQKYDEKSFGKEADKLKRDMDQQIEIIHAVLPRENVDSRKSKKFAKNKPYASIHVMKDKDIVLRESGFDTFPYVVPRWIKTSGEVYGRSPTMKALPDIKMINQIMKTTIRAAQKAVDPPLMVPDDGYLGRVKTTPGGLNPYRAGTQDLIRPIDTGANPGIGIDIMEDIRTRIRQSYYIDQLQLREGPQMTATEVNARVDDQLRLLGPILGRLHFELLQPLIARVIQIMIDKGLMPEEAPEELDDVDPQIVYSSQIARAQKMTEANNLDQFLGILAGIVQIDPSIYDLIDPEQYARLSASFRNVPEDVFRDPDAVEQIRQNRAENQQDQRQLEDSVAASQATKNSAEAVQKLRQG